MNRFMNFSQKQLATIDLGVELYRHYLYERENIDGRHNKFATFARTTADNGVVLDYKTKNELFHKMLIDEAYEISGLSKERFDVRNAFTFQPFERAYFAVVEEVLNKVNSKVEIEQALMFAEVKSIADGDSLLFHIPSNHLLTVSTVANGQRNVHFQKLWSEDFTITPVPKKIGVSIDIYRLSAGMEDYGHLIATVAKSFRAKLLQEITDTIYGAYDTLGTNFKEATFEQTSYIKLAERVAAANGAPVMAIGTRSALAKILPTSDYVLMSVGQEYMSKGYIESPFGIPTIKLEQVVKPNSNYDFAISNDYIIIMSALSDKPVKVGMEGYTTIRQSKDFETADDSKNYTITSKWECSLISQSHYGIVKCESSSEGV